MAKILVGTCSWTDPTLLAANFYPNEANTPERRLQYYARNFNLVEVDSTYYSMPTERNSRLWVERTPEDFTFDIKAFRLFTQHPTKIQAFPNDIGRLMPAMGKTYVYYRDIADETRNVLWQRFNEAVLPLDSAGKLGVVLFQFPEWFFPGRTSREHILQCKHNLPQFRLAIEFRNAAWLEENRRQETFGFLKDNNLAYVNVDEPQGFRSSVPPIAGATSDIAVIRFHGRNSNNWERKAITVVERFKYLYSDQELGEWLPKIAELSAKAKQLHVLFNNCYADWGVRNARDIDRLMGSQPSLFPDYATPAKKELPGQLPPIHDDYAAMNKI